MKIYICQKCGAVFKGELDKIPECGSCQVKTIYSGFDEEKWYAYSGKEREELKNKIQQSYVDEQQIALKKIVVTSGFTLEGYRIKQYLDYSTGTCVLGTGFLSTISATTADYLGGKSKGYEGKLEEAKEYALQDLRIRAKQLGGNAIIGTSLSLTTFRSDLIGVVITGTIVVVEPEQNGV